MNMFSLYLKPSMMHLYRLVTVLSLTMSTTRLLMTIYYLFDRNNSE